MSAVPYPFPPTRQANQPARPRRRRRSRRTRSRGAGRGRAARPARTPRGPGARANRARTGKGKPPFYPCACFQWQRERGERASAAASDAKRSKPGEGTAGISPKPRIAVVSKGGEEESQSQPPRYQPTWGFCPHSRAATGGGRRRGSRGRGGEAGSRRAPPPARCCGGGTCS